MGGSSNATLLNSSAGSSADAPDATFRNRLHLSWTMGTAFFVMGALLPFFLVATRRKSEIETVSKWHKRWSDAVTAATGVTVVGHMVEPLDESRSYVFIANHKNAMDILGVLSGIDLPLAFVAKTELGEVPLLGAVLRRSKSVMVDRSSPRKAVASITDAANFVRSGASIVLFPEGTRSATGEMLPFKRGAFEIAVKAKAPIVPVTILGSGKLLSEQDKASRPGRIDVLVGRPIETESYDRESIPDLIAASRAAIEEGQNSSLVAS